MARILVVDNHPAVLQSMKIFLEAAGHTVVVAADGREALGKASGQPPDLALLDFELPDMSGTDLCRAIKADPALRGVPVVLVTGAVLQAVEPAALAAGAEAVIGKPFTIEGLQTGAAKYLRK